ncbi:flagellar basal body-associated FliL family protein [Clostridium butyricum]|uniref:Flagellar protein FliL n=2 Tax=Clostridium butyricum TaxID=1492 RepID=C4IDK0_CLOBU|nr:flagellar basal body-associated FliL family protein [Clostridium butyricum]APF23626.1 flagellar basal body-associated FliL family protein [Clostridium butyricum]EDT75370.1 flagellar basal body-associated protein FliL [Clostridium butyricum 5521]EEP55373.1 flagellar basal body-associated protein FliL [Clostridium butyricum E4 str. BoNT E BL5262]KHD15769.1 flagellar basal body protein FliL [Clostridium butyricum]NFL31287.1 flagellar basal body protein FliL [Clostridium butyricum]
MAKKENDKGKENIEGKTKSGKGLMVILFILGLIVLGGATFGGVYLFMKTNKTVSAQEVVVENAYVDLEEFTVNLADEGGKRYFKGELSVGYDKSNKKMAEEITANTVVVRDTVIFYFKGQKADFINNINNEQKIKDDLISAINKQLQKGKITDIRFKNMIVQ